MGFPDADCADAYVVLEDVSRDEGLVYARVLVRFEVLQRVFGDTLMLRSFYARQQTFRICGRVGSPVYTPLLGGMLGWVAGAGSDMRGSGNLLYRQRLGHMESKGLAGTQSHADVTTACVFKARADFRCSFR